MRTPRIGPSRRRVRTRRRLVATPAEIRALIDATEQSRWPEYARAILVAARQGLRRAELCGLRRRRDLDLDGGVLTVSSTAVALPQAAVEEILTKNRRVRSIVLDDLTVSILRAQLDSLEARARVVRVELVEDAFVFSDALDASVPWKPDRVTQYFNRLRGRAGTIEPARVHDRPRCRTAPTNFRRTELRGPQS